MFPRTLRLRIAAFAAALALPLAMSACTSPSGADVADLEALIQARADWARLGVDSYTFVVGPRCYCGDTREIRITVVDGVATQRVHVDDGSSIPVNYYTGISTIASLLDTVEDALQQGAADVNVTYDARGVPTEAMIDYQSNVVDEEFGWAVTSFTPTP